MAPASLKQKNFRRALLQTYLLPPILLSVLAAVLVWEINRLLETERLITHTDEVIAQTHVVEKLLVDMETGTRGFLITGDPTFLGPHEVGNRKIDGEIAKLEQLVADNPAQLKRLEELKPLQSEWREFAVRVQQIKRSGGDYESAIASGVGRQLMDRLRTSLGDFVETETQLRNQRSRSAERWTRIVVGLGIALTLILGLVLATLARRQLVRVSQSYEAVLQASRTRANALKDSEERYRMLFDSNPQPTWLYDVETLEFLAVNEAAISHYGFTREEFLSMTIKDIRPEQDVPRLLEKVSQASDHLEDAGIWRHRKKDGSLIDVWITSHPFDLDGRHCEIVLATDVTQRLQAERRLRELNEQLEQKVSERTRDLQEANRELESFTYSVSHDLRSPLRAINGFSQILLEEYGETLPDPAKKYLDHVCTGAKQMGQLIDDLLAFSRIGRHSLKKQKVETNTIVESVLDDLKSEQEGRSVSIEMTELPTAQADPALLKQVYANLLSNALKYTRGRHEAKIVIGATKVAHPESTVYYVRDNGAGFDMRYAGKLFGVFQRLHRAEEFEGTGVGLATTERIVRRHGGRIWAEAELDRGATFFFTLQGENGE